RRMAAQGRDAERQDGSFGVRVDARGDHRGHPRRQASVPARLNARQSLAAAAPPRGRGSRQDQEWRGIPPERQARTELARVNRELKQLRSQLAALEERRVALVSELAGQG